MIRWAILTGEYPPQPGGVSDYTRLVAGQLAAAGDAVTVFSPPHDGGALDDPGVRVCRLSDHFGPRGLLELEHSLARSRADRILVQYVPHAFGWKGMNLAFAAWLARRARRFAAVDVMFHEVTFPFRRWPPSHAALGVINRAMARLIAVAADRVFVSVPVWGELLRAICPPAKRAAWLPVPCNVGTTAATAAVASVRRRYAPGGEKLVGHFGTFGRLIADLVEPAAVALLREHAAARLLLIGRGSEAFRYHFAAAHPDVAGRVAATGELAACVIPAHLRACDLLLQPFPDGVSSRRTSVMAGLANGTAVATNVGPLSEPLWADTGCVAIGPDAATRLLADSAECAATAARGLDVYRSQFAVERLIARLRESA